MVKPLAFNDLAPLATLYRGGMAESFHHGVAVLLAADGNILKEVGNAKAQIFPRSALKPVQAVAMREMGLQLSGQNLVLSMASHLGTTEHRSLVAGLLTEYGFSEADLQCPIAYPASLSAKGDPSSRLAMNCSGKHASFLATCKINNWSASDYLNLEHPLQQGMKQKIEQLAAEKIALTTTDGCGAPLFAMSTLGLARSTAGFMSEGASLFEAAKANPWIIGDHDTADAVFLRHGLMAKIGAEGVFVVGLQTGEALAIKIADGNLRAAPALAANLLKDFGLITQACFEKLWLEVAPKILGGDKIMGELILE